MTSKGWPSYIVQAGTAVDLFHGTSVSNADQILKDNFKISNDSDCYLGPGVYFCESDVDMAEWWAKSHKRLISYIIIRATANLGIVFFINREAKKLIEEFKEKIFMRRGESLSDGRIVEIIIKESLPLLGIKVDTVKKIIDGSYRYVDVCVRNPSNITEREEYRRV